MHEITAAKAQQFVLGMTILSATLAFAQENDAARALCDPHQDRRSRQDKPGSENRPSRPEHGFVSEREINGLLKPISLNVLMPDYGVGVRAMRQSFWALQTIQGGRVVVPMLMRAFKEHPGGSGLVPYFLEEIGPNCEEAVPDLIELLKSAQGMQVDARGNRTVPSPMRICDILAAIGPKARPAVPVLLEFLNDRDANVRMAAVHALVEIGCQTPKTEAALKALLHDGNPKVRVWTLSKILASGRAHISLTAAMVRELEMLLDDPSNDVRIEAAAGLVQCEESTDRVIQTLEDVLGARDAANALSRTSGVLALLTKLGSKAHRVAPRVREFLARQRDDGNALRCYALIALLAIEGPSDQINRDVVSAIKKAPVAIVRPEIASTLLASEGPLRDSAIDATMRLLNERNVPIESRIMFETIGKLGKMAAPLVPSLTKILREKDSYQCQMAVRALGCIGFPDPDALDVLHHLATSDDVCVRLQARDTILRLKSGKQKKHAD